MPLAPAVLADASSASPEQERRFFEQLRLPNGTWKTTYRHRLDDLNELLLGLLPVGRKLEVMDVGISSGISTVEWSEQLAAHGIDHRIVAGDIQIAGRLTTFGSWFSLVCDEGGGEPLLLEVGPFSLPIRSERRTVRVLRPLLTRLLRGLAMSRSCPVFLVTAEARRAPQIEVVCDDVLEPGHFEARFDVLRAANLVQRSYFDEPTLRQAIANLRDRIRDGGLLALCHTVEGVNRATVFRRDDDQLVAVAFLGGGVEVRELVLST